MNSIPQQHDPAPAENGLGHRLKYVGSIYHRQVPDFEGVTFVTIEASTVHNHFRAQTRSFFAFALRTQQVWVSPSAACASQMRPIMMAASKETSPQRAAAGAEVNDPGTCACGYHSLLGIQQWKISLLLCTSFKTPHTPSRLRVGRCRKLAISSPGGGNRSS